MDAIEEKMGDKKVLTSDEKKIENQTIERRH